MYNIDKGLEGYRDIEIKSNSFDILGANHPSNTNQCQSLNKNMYQSKRQTK